jgi:hypothetical protein
MATGPKGEKHLCGSCGNWHAPHRPDNCTQVPICVDCWKTASVNARVFALSLAKVSASVGALDNTVVELLDGVTSAVAAVQRGSGRSNSDN